MLAVLIGHTPLHSQTATSPIWPTTQWQTSAPEEQGMDSAALARLIDFGAGQNLDSLLIARHGKIVLDAAYAPYSSDTPHVVNSVTKAVVGTLAAIALKHGVLDSTSHPVLPFFGERNAANADDRKSAITLQSLLDMTSGLAWQEPLSDERPDSMIDMERSPDWVQFILDRPMAHAPGESFNYNSGNPHLLSAILTKVTGMSTEDYAKAKLFGPLGINRWQWRRDPQGISIGGYGLALLPRDMAKFGYLYLRRGEWEGKLLIASDWVEQVSHATVDMHASFDPALRYSNFFWVRPGRQVYWANGYHCQTIMVYPALDLVAVTTARGNCALRKLATSVAEAVRSVTALPSNPDGAQLLENAVRNASIEKPTEHGPMSPLASTVSGKTYNFRGNTLGVKSLSLALGDSQPRYDLELYNRNPRGPVLRFSGPIGVDGLYRKGDPSALGVSAVKGNWSNDRTLVIDRLMIGASADAQRWTLLFDGDKLNLRGKDYSGSEVSIDSEPGG
jgi:CubicO group peptidase (beta-lactamase class C family)